MQRTMKRRRQLGLPHFAAEEEKKSEEGLLFPPVAYQQRKKTRPRRAAVCSLQRLARLGQDQLVVVVIFFLGFWWACLGIFMMIWWPEGGGQGLFFWSSLTQDPSMPLLFAIAHESSSSVMMPPMDLKMPSTDEGPILYWDLDVNEIDYDSEDNNLADTYYAFDDDAIKAEKTEFQHTDPHGDYHVHHDGHCRRVSEHTLQFSTCNLIQEQDRLDNEIKKLGEGYFREVFGGTHKGARTTSNPQQTLQAERFVYKQLRHKRDILDVELVEYMRMDALVAERLTASPRIFDVYAFCGVTLLTEYFYHGDIEVQMATTTPYSVSDIPKNEEWEDWVGYAPLEPEQNKTIVESYNDIPIQEKLKIALDMAMGLADLHGYAGGVLIHDDVQPCQYLYNADKSILKLNDFNRAEWMLWDDENQEYCRYKNGVGPGNMRSPEEYENEPLNEKIDVYSLGNNIYVLLTGLWPFFHIDSYKEVARQVKHKKQPFVHPNWKGKGPIERTLVHVLERCWVHRPDDRADIFEIVQILQSAWEKYGSLPSTAAMEVEKE